MNSNIFFFNSIIKIKIKIIQIVKENVNIVHKIINFFFIKFASHQIFNFP